MKNYYEVIHRGITKKFENEEEAMHHSKTLEKLGYAVLVKYISLSVYCEIKTIIYKSPYEVV